MRQAPGDQISVWCEGPSRAVSGAGAPVLRALEHRGLGQVPMDGVHSHGGGPDPQGALRK